MPARSSSAQAWIICSHPPTSLHRRTARLDPAAGSSHLASCHHRGHGSQHGPPAARLPLRRALSFRQRSVHRRASAAGEVEPRSLVALHQGAAGKAGVVMAISVPRARCATSAAQCCSAEPGPRLVLLQGGSRLCSASGSLCSGRATRGPACAAPRPGHESRRLRGWRT